MAPTERAGWLADKICNGGDYGKEAAILLVKQAEQIERLRAANEAVAMLILRNDREEAVKWANGTVLTEALLVEVMRTPNV